MGDQHFATKHSHSSNFITCPQDTHIPVSHTAGTKGTITWNTLGDDLEYLSRHLSDKEDAEMLPLLNIFGNYLIHYPS